jgi:hypothetical protein
MDIKNIPYWLKGSILGYVITFLVMVVLFAIGDPNNFFNMIPGSAIFALVGIIFGLIAGIIFGLIHTKKRRFILSLGISLGLMILFIIILAYFIYFFTPSSTIRITNMIIPEEDFSDYYFFSTFRTFKGSTSFDFIGDFGNLTSRINPSNIRPGGLIFNNDPCMNIFIIPKTEYNSSFDLRKSNAQQVISNLCYRTIESPYKNIAKIEHIYRINTNFVNESPAEVKISRTPMFILLAILCLAIIYFNISIIMKLSKN